MTARSARFPNRASSALRRWGLVVCTSLGTGFAGAEAPDFSAGFQKFQALGLPDLAGAKWVHEAGGGMGIGGGYQMRQLFRNVNGNAWQLAEGGKVIAAGELEVRDPRGAVGTGPGGRLLMVPGQEPSDRSAEVTPASDVQALIAALGSQDNDPFGAFGASSADPETLARLFLLAAQFHSAGHTAEANRLAAAAFAVPGDPTVVIDSAISVLANDRCRLALEKFYEKPDWKALTAQLDGFVTRFSRGWGSREEISDLSARIKTQVAKGAPPPPAPLEPVPESLTTAVRAWLAGAAEDPDSETSTNETAETDEEETDEEEMEDEVAEDVEEDELAPLWTLPADPDDGAPLKPAFLNEGVHVLAALIPLLSDTTLLPQPAVPTGEYSEYSYEAINSKSLPASYRLPATRANLVEPLVRAVIPNSSELDADALAAAAAAFWKNHAKKPPVELAALYLQEGDDSQQHGAAQWLSQTTATGAEEAFAVWSTEPAQVVNRLPITKEFVRQRGAAAAGLVEKLSAALRESAARPASDEEETAEDFLDPSGRRRPPMTLEETEGVIRSLNLLASGNSLAESLVQVATAAEPAGLVLGAMGSEIFDAPFEEALPAVLKAAAGATVANRPSFIHVATGLTFRFESSNYRQGPGGSPKLPDLGDIVDEPLLALLENEEALPPGNQGSLLLETVADAAALIAERLNDHELLRKSGELHALTGEPVTGFLRQRALARLKQQPMPDWPDAAKTTPERLQEIVASLTGVAPPEIVERLAALSLDERAAFVAWMEKPDNPPIPDALKTMRTAIHGTRPTSLYGPAPFGSKSAEVGAVAGFNAGDTLSAETFESRAKALLPSAPERPPLVAMFIRPAKLNLGWNLAAFTADAKAEGSDQELKETADGQVPLKSLMGFFRHGIKALEAEEDATAVATLWIYGNRQQHMNHWLLQPDGTITATEEEESPSSALEALQEILPSDDGGNSTIILTVITREQSKVFQADSEE